MMLTEMGSMLTEKGQMQVIFRERRKPSAAQ
jgi:hypothetical protein